eukprot:UN10847
MILVMNYKKMRNIYNNNSYKISITYLQIITISIIVAVWFKKRLNPKNTT